MPAITVRSALINKIGSNEVTTLRVSVDRSLASAGGPSSAGVVASGAVTVSVGTFLLPALTLYSTYNAPDAATQGAIYKAELLDGSGNVVTELPGFASFLLRVPATQCTWNSIQEWNDYLTLIQATNLDTLGNSTTPVVGLSCVGVLGAYTTASRDTITLFFGSSINAPGIRRNVATAQMEYSHDGLTWAAMGSGGGSGVTGSGTVSYVPLWTAGTVLGDSPISYASIDLTVVINNHTSLEKSLKIGNDQFVFNGDPARAVNVNQAVFKTITGQTGDVLRVDNTANTGGFPFRVRANGDVYIRGIAYQWPSGAPAGVLTNDGSLNLSWAAPTVTIQDEGATQGAASTLNFVGGAVTASVSSGIATITITGGGGMTSWNFAADSGTTPQSISDAQTLTFVGGNGITTNGSGTRQLTIAVDLLSTGGLQTSGGAAQLGIKLDTVTGGGNNAAVLSANGLYVPPGGGGGGTVTSVGLSLPSFITVSGSPVTTSGTLTGTLAAQSANTVFAGPATGAAAAPTFRALVNADIASLRTWTVEDSDGSTLAITGGTQFGILGDGNSIVTNLAGNSVEISVQTLNTGGLTILPGGLAIQLDTVTGGGNNVAQLGANGLYVPPGSGSGTVNSGTIRRVAHYAATGTAVSDAPGFEYQSGASPNVSMTAQNLAHVALRVRPNGNAATAAALEVVGNTDGALFLVDPVIGDSRSYGHVSLLGTASTPATQLAVIGGTSGADNSGQIVVAPDNSGTTGLDLSGNGTGPTFDNSSFLQLASASLVRSGNNDTGGLNLISSHPNAPIRLAAGGFALTNEVMRLAAGGIFQKAPATALADGSLINGTIHFYLNEPSNQLLVKVKESGGSVYTRQLAREFKTVTAVSANYALTPSTDNVLVVNTAGGNITITLTTPGANDPRDFHIKKQTTDANNVILTPASGQIDNAASFTFNGVIGSSGESRHVVWDGTNWWIL